MHGMRLLQNGPSHGQICHPEPISNINNAHSNDATATPQPRHNNGNTPPLPPHPFAPTATPHPTARNSHAPTDGLIGVARVTQRPELSAAAVLLATAARWLAPPPVTAASAATARWRSGHVSNIHLRSFAIVGVFLGWCGRGGQASHGASGRASATYRGPGNKGPVQDGQAGGEGGHGSVPARYHRHDRQPASLGPNRSPSRRQSRNREIRPR